MAGESGGGAFVLVYLVLIAAVGVPIMLAEVMLGRMGRQSPINSMLSLSERYGSTKAWSVIGVLGVIAGFMILSFYAMIAGWILYYVVEMAMGTFVGADAEFIGSFFNDFVGDIPFVTLWFTLFLAVTMFIVARGVSRGLEATVKYAMPLLFALLFLVLGYGIVEGGFPQAFTFLFEPDFSKLTIGNTLAALGHAFFTLSVGMGAIMVYGAYVPEKVSLKQTVFLVAGMDTFVALLAGLGIFSIVFANGLDPEAGPGLLFQTTPLAFGSLPAGSLFGFLFFVTVALAALTSAISLIEPFVAYAVEKLDTERWKVAAGTGVVVWVLGLGSIFSGEIFDFLDQLTTIVFLPLTGLLIALFAAFVVREEDRNAQLELSTTDGLVWKLLIGLVAPLGVAMTLSSGVVGFFGMSFGA